MPAKKLTEEQKRATPFAEKYYREQKAKARKIAAQGVRAHNKRERAKFLATGKKSKHKVIMDIDVSPPRYTGHIPASEPIISEAVKQKYKKKFQKVASIFQKGTKVIGEKKESKKPKKKFKSEFDKLYKEAKKEYKIQVPKAIP